jgi:MFS transporter, DHA2 family, multidrug resistance protein
MGALLTAGFASALSSAIAAAPNKALITGNVANALTKSFASAEAVAKQYPHYAGAITSAARSSFVSGADWSYVAGMIGVALGGLLIFFLFPGRGREEALLAEYQASDAGPAERAPGVAAAGG